VFYTSCITSSLHCLAVYPVKHHKGESSQFHALLHNMAPSPTKLLPLVMRETPITCNILLLKGLKVTSPLEGAHGFALLSFVRGVAREVKKPHYFSPPLQRIALLILSHARAQLMRHFSPIMGPGRTCSAWPGKVQLESF
jgi:hypothetical protein